MKTHLLFICTLLTLTFCQVGYSQVFEKGNVILNAGIGLGSTFTFAGLGLPIGGGAEFGITDAIGVGGEIGFVSASGLSILYVGPKGYYHLNDILKLESDELDIYGGVSILYRSFSFKEVSFAFSSGLYPGIFAGGRYYFSENVAAYAELGNSYSWFKVGACLKL